MHNIGLSSSGLAVDVLGSAAFGNWAEVWGAFSRGFDPVTARDRFGSSLLHFAAGSSGRHNLPLVQVALDMGADVNARRTDGCTPLHWAAQEGSAEVCRVLLAAGARADAVTVDGRSVLCEVVRFGAVGDALERARVLLLEPALDLVTPYQGLTPEQRARARGLAALGDMIAEEVWWLCQCACVGEGACSHRGVPWLYECV
jgi:hypothetical protein